MRTKALLLTAVLGVAGVSATVAQTNSVYTENTVGYINLTLPAGFTMLADPLIDGSNDLNSILTSVPSGTLAYFLDTNSAFDLTTFTNAAWTPTDNTLAPGNGALVFLPKSAAVTFVGNVPQGTLITHIPAGLSIESIQVPLAESLTNSQVNFPAAEGDTIYRFNNTSGQFTVTTYTHGRLLPGDVIPAVGESFYVLKSTPADWTTTFSVNDVKPRRWTNSTALRLETTSAALSFAQGTINFCNVAGVLNQPVLDGAGRPLDTNGTGNFLAELMAGPDASHLSLAPASITRIVDGQFFGGSVALSTTPTNGTAAARVVAWDGAAAADFFTAVQNGAAVGESAVFNVSVSTATYPVPPATMTNLTSFVVKTGGVTTGGGTVLTISLSGTNAVLSWTGAANISLQKTLGLSPANWQDVAGSLGVGSLTNAPKGTNTFYRTIAR